MEHIRIPLEGDTFHLNGCTNLVDEPYPFLDQLHGVLCCITKAVDEETDAINPKILSSALKGAETLAYLAGLGLAYQDAKREGR